MDITLAQTFLAIAETGSFVRAAKSLNVTQSTVSARIKVLEEQLGRPLFTRSKAGVAPTAAGSQFERHARTLVRVWQQACHEVSLPADQRQVINVGAQSNLWDGVLLDWLSRMRRDHPEVGVRTEIGTNDHLMRLLVDGLIDAAIMYTPQTRPGIVIEQLLEETLVLTATRRGRRAEEIDDYVFIDWGTEFGASHAAQFPAGESPGLIAGIAALGLAFLLRNGGAGYFPIRLVKPLIESGRLHLVDGAPRFRRPAYLAYYPNDDHAALGVALDGLRREGRRADRVRPPRPVQTV